MICFLALLPVTVMSQGFNQATFVYIECYELSGTRVSRGSGVLVSRDGRVLTAKHVIRDGSTCRASLGTGATVPSRRLSRGRASYTYDAMIMKLIPDADEVFPAIRYARISGLKGKTITAHGVSADGTGEVSARKGTIATAVPDDAGHLETDALTARGMSGGPVVLDETGALIGIVVGADLDVTTGLPTNFPVLAAQEVATELDLELQSGQTQPRVCRHPSHGVEKWNSEERWTVNNNWKTKGGPDTFCKGQLNDRQVKYPDRTIQLIDKSEQHKTVRDPFKHDYYLYTCWFRDAWDPVYRLAESEHCEEDGRN
jgi:hypothetical protein